MGGGRSILPTSFFSSAHHIFASSPPHVWLGGFSSPGVPHPTPMTPQKKFTWKYSIYNSTKISEEMYLVNGGGGGRTFRRCLFVPLSLRARTTWLELLLFIVAYLPQRKEDFELLSLLWQGHRRHSQWAQSFRNLYRLILIYTVALINKHFSLTYTMTIT